MDHFSTPENILFSVDSAYKKARKSITDSILLGVLIVSVATLFVLYYAKELANNGFIEVTRKNKVNRTRIHEKIYAGDLITHPATWGILIFLLAGILLIYYGLYNYRKKGDLFYFTEDGIFRKSATGILFYSWNELSPKINLNVKKNDADLILYYSPNAEVMERIKSGKERIKFEFNSTSKNVGHEIHITTIKEHEAILLLTKQKLKI